MAGLRATIYNRDLPNLKQDCHTLERNTALKKIAGTKKTNPFSLVGLPTAFELLKAGNNILTQITRLFHKHNAPQKNGDL